MRYITAQKRTRLFLWVAQTSAMGSGLGFFPVRLSHLKGYTRFLYLCLFSCLSGSLNVSLGGSTAVTLAHSLSHSLSFRSFPLTLFLPVTLSLSHSLSLSLTYFSLSLPHFLSCPLPLSKICLSPRHFFSPPPVSPTHTSVFLFLSVSWSAHAKGHAGL